MNFPGLIPCDHCSTMVEPHVVRCYECERRHGKPPEANGVRGQTAPKPKRTNDKTPGRPLGRYIECVGPTGQGCPERRLVRRDRKGKRCRWCQVKFNERTDPRVEQREQEVTR